MKKKTFSNNLLIWLAFLRMISNVKLKSFKTSRTERLKFQKTVYFLKVFGFDFGYDFNWFIYGPYSPTLTKDTYSFLNTTKLNRVPKIKLLDEDLERNFKIFLKFLGNKKSDAKWLELISSIHFLFMAKKTRNEIIKTMLIKRTIFNEKDIKEGFSYLKKFRLIG